MGRGHLPQMNVVGLRFTVRALIGGLQFLQVISATVGRRQLVRCGKWYALAGRTVRVDCASIVLQVATVQERDSSVLVAVVHVKPATGVRPGACRLVRLIVAKAARIRRSAMAMVTLRTVE